MMASNNQPNEFDENNGNGTTTTTTAEKEKVVENLMKEKERSRKQQTKRLQVRPTILITGFGPFQDIQINPTTVIVNELRDYLISSSKNELWKQNLVYHIQDCIVMDTSVENVCKTLDSYYNNNYHHHHHHQQQLNEEEEEEEGETTNNNTTVAVDIILHLGVHYKAKGFHIEQYAYNDATFRIPDECGYQPKGELIINSKQLGESIQTQINVEELVANQTKLFSNVITNLSDNPGRFVCNYTYCYSLYHLLDNNNNNNNKNKDEGEGEGEDKVDVVNDGIAIDNDNNKRNNNNHNHKQICLFLHVPKFEVVSKEIQLEYVSTLIQKLIELHQTDTTTTTTTIEKVIKEGGESLKN